MWTEIEQKKQQLDSRRPLSVKDLKALDGWYDVFLTYTSNAIEGNTLTHSETALVLEKGITVRGKPLSDHLEAIDHKEAIAYVRELAQRNVVITEHDIKSIHQLVLGRSNKEEAGRYSSFARSVVGSTVKFPSPVEVPPLMGEFGNWLSSVENTPQNAIEAHARLVTIHPFSDGNGRTGRLLMNLILIKGGYPPVVVKPEDKPDYIDALELRQLAGDIITFENFIGQRLIESLDSYLDKVSKEFKPRTTQEFEP